MEYGWQYLHVAIEFMKVIVWPLVALIIVVLLRDFIQELSVKHNGTELKVVTKGLKDSKKGGDKILNKIKRKLPKEAEDIQAHFDRLYRTAMSVVEDRAAEVESGSNDDGSHILYNNGQVVQEITIAAGGLIGRKACYLPSKISEVSAVTLVGQEKPKLVHVDSSRIEVDLDQKNESEIKIIVSGIA